MEERESSTFYRALTPLQCFLRVTISQPKVRIKFPKSLDKTKQRSNTTMCNNGNAGHNKSKKKIWVRPRKLFSKKVGFIFSYVFGNKKSEKMDETHDVKSNYLNGQKNKSIAKEGKVFKANSLKKIFEIAEDKEEKKKKRLNKEKHVQERKSRPSMVCHEPSRKVPKSISSFIHKNSGLSFIRGKNKKANRVNANSANTICNGGDRGSANNVSGTSLVVSGRQESSSSLPRVPSKLLNTRTKLKMATYSRKKVNLEEGKTGKEDGEREESRGDEELCKKRILMGEKCKPLGFSGKLRYDQNGVILPEIMP